MYARVAIVLCLVSSFTSCKQIKQAIGAGESATNLVTDLVDLDRNTNHLTIDKRVATVNNDTIKLDTPISPDHEAAEVFVSSVKAHVPTDVVAAGFSSLSPEERSGIAKDLEQQLGNQLGRTIRSQQSNVEGSRFRIMDAALGSTVIVEAVASVTSINISDGAARGGRSRGSESVLQLRVEVTLDMKRNGALLGSTVAVLKQSRKLKGSIVQGSDELRKSTVLRAGGVIREAVTLAARGAAIGSVHRLAKKLKAVEAAHSKSGK